MAGDGGRIERVVFAEAGMSTMPVTSSAPPVQACERLIVYLRMIHAEWLLEARRVLDAARRPGAGTWIRWSAIRWSESAPGPRSSRP
jgi:hypothetical protein